MATTRVDDRSSSIIYAGGWGMGGAPVDYNDSVTYATLAGQTATLAFRGVGVSVFGHIMKNSPGIPPPVSSYSIDGGTTTTYYEVQDDNEHPNQQFYQSPVLSNDQHTIVLTNVFGNHAAYFLDYFLVTAGDNTASTPLPASTMTTVATPATTPRYSSTSDSSSVVFSSTGVISPSSILSTMHINGTIVTVTTFPSPPISTSSPAIVALSSGSPSSALQGHAWMIAGLTLGAVAAIIILVVIAFCCVRKRRRDQNDWQTVSEFVHQPHLSQWRQQVAGSGFSAPSPHSKFPQSPTDGPSQWYDHSSQSHGHTPVVPRPPSYSQEPPSYTFFRTQNQRPSKLAESSPNS